MDKQLIFDLFRQEIWTKQLPKNIVIPSLFFKLKHNDIQFLIDDDTNPNIEHFLIGKDVEQAIDRLNGSVFVKVAGRTARDSTSLSRKITSVGQLVMLVKMSEYLTEGLSEDQEEADLILRQYKVEFQNGFDEYRAYMIGGKLVGICQKQTSFLMGDMTENQINSIQRIGEVILNKFKEQNSKIFETIINIFQFVFDVYCSPNGKQTYLFAIEPFHIHGLCLFTEQQLRTRFTSEKKQPLTRTVKNEAEMKQLDLTQYKAGSQLKHLENVQQWIEFMKKEEQLQ